MIRLKYNTTMSIITLNVIQQHTTIKIQIQTAFFKNKNFLLEKEF